MLNVAVIGAGSMGKNHVRVLSELDNVKLVAIADANKELGKSLAEKFRCKFYEDYNLMLEKEDIKAVSIAVPTNLHHKVAVDVIKHGKHLLVEKPIASTVEEAEDIISKANQKGLKLMVGHIERFNPAVVELKRRIPELGKVYKIVVNRIGPFPARIRDVGVVIDLAVHDLDIVTFLTGSKIMDIHSVTGKKIHSQHEDMLCALGRLDNGAAVMLNIDWLTPVVKRELSITGERGMFVANYLSQELFFFENSSVKGDIDYSKPVKNIEAGDMIKIKIVNNEPLKLELQAFVDSVVNDKPSPVSGEDGLKALKSALKVLEVSKGA